MAVTKNQILAYTTSEDVIVGSGNGKINFKAVKSNLGNRVALKGTFPIQTTSGSPQVSKSVEATLVAAAETVSFDQETWTVIGSGGNVTVTGKSNSSTLTFTLGAGSLTITLPGSYSVGGVSTPNGDAIADDPGASAMYNFSMTISVPENAGVTELTKTLDVTAEGGQTATSTIRQSAGEPELTISATTIQVPQTGAAVSLDVTSNTTWTIVS